MRFVFFNGRGFNDDSDSTLTELQSTNVRLKDENLRLKKTCLLGENTAEMEKTNRDLKNKLKGLGY